MQNGSDGQTVRAEENTDRHALAHNPANAGAHAHAHAGMPHSCRDNANVVIDDSKSADMICFILNVLLVMATLRTDRLYSRRCGPVRYVRNVLSVLSESKQDKSTMAQTDFSTCSQ